MTPGFRKTSGPPFPCGFPEQIRVFRGVEAGVVPRDDQRSSDCCPELCRKGAHFALPIPKAFEPGHGLYGMGSMRRTKSSPVFTRTYAILATE